MIKKSDLKRLRNNYIYNKDNIILQRLVRSTELTNLICDNDTSLDVKFNYEIKTHGITNQNDSGRCWIFGGLNILRESVINNCKLDNFELSASYLSYYDKLERFNYYQDRLISLIKEGKDIYDKDINDILKVGIEDGGYFTGFKDLVKKYGVVPKDIYPESYQSSNTGEVNQILTRLLKKFYLEVELNIERCDKIKDKYLEYVYNVLSSLYGTIVDKFNFEYVDINNKYHIDKNITPKQFYDKYVKVDLDNYIEVYSYEDNVYKYNTLYQINNSSYIEGYKDYLCLNVSHEVLKNLLLRQIKNNECVYFSTSTPNKMISGIWIDTFSRYGEIFNIDLSLSNNDILKVNETSNEHVMIFTGVSIINNKPVKWKVENSWGDKEGNKGYYVATDDFVNKYVFNIIINKKYLTNKQLSILNNKPISINRKYSKF